MGAEAEVREESISKETPATFDAAMTANGGLSAENDSFISIAATSYMLATNDKVLKAQLNMNNVFYMSGLGPKERNIVNLSWLVKTRHNPY